MSEILGDLVKVRNNLKRIADDKGLNIQFFTIVPGPDEDGPHQVMVLFRTKSDDDLNSDNKKFNQIMEAEAKSELATERESKKEERFSRLPDELDAIERDLNSGDGLLDD